MSLQGPAADARLDASAASDFVPITRDPPDRDRRWMSSSMRPSLTMQDDAGRPALVEDVEQLLAARLFGTRGRFGEARGRHT